jgi:hypothetical protein
MPITTGVSGAPIIGDDDKVVGIVTEETMFWPPELTAYSAAVQNRPDDKRLAYKVKLPTGQKVDARKMLGTLALVLHEFGSPGAGLAVPTSYLKPSAVASR